MLYSVIHCYSMLENCDVNLFFPFIIIEGKYVCYYFHNFYESPIGHHLISNPECARTYTDDNFRIIGQARSSFHLSVLESAYLKTQTRLFSRLKEFVFSLGLFKQQ